MSPAKIIRSARSHMGVSSLFLQEYYITGVSSKITPNSSRNIRITGSFGRGGWAKNRLASSASRIRLESAWPSQVVRVV
jgi:hypothetical protein